MVSHITRIMQPLPTTLRIETGIVGHRDDALLHLVESYHLLQVVKTPFKRIGRGNKQTGVDILQFKERNLLPHHLYRPPHIARTDILCYHPSDVAERPIWESILTSSFDDGP